MANIVLFVFGILNLLVFVGLVVGLANPSLSIFNRISFLNEKSSLAKRLYFVCIYLVISTIICCVCVPFIDEEIKSPDNIIAETIPTITEDDKKEDSLLLVRCKALFEEFLSFKDEKEFEEYGFGTGGKYHKWLIDVRNFSDEDNKRLMIYGIVPGELEQLGMDYTNPSISEDGIKSRTELEHRLTRIFDLQIRNDADFSIEAEQAYNNDCKTIIGKWKLQSKDSGRLSTLEIFSLSNNYYYIESYTDGSNALKGKLIKKGKYYYQVPSISGDYFFVTDRKLCLGDDGGIYEDGTKGYYSITTLE